ncbi:MAG: thioredoxin-disulfide reductase [Candidatus Cloacimonadota bacterium]|nr:MAG: thioredoxin-disulfide reductase [Candidatus Cloacimonadota bacterium]
MNEIYDLIIIGGGPGGLSAGVYAARSKMKTLCLEEKRRVGGQCATTTEMENYPGILESTGPGLMDNFRAHCEKFGVEFRRGKVDSLEIAEDGFIKTVNTQKGEKIYGKSIIISTGAEARVLGIPGERELRGRGVSYCATCDADFFEDLDIIVVGSGNTAVEESVFLTKFVNKITMVILHEEGKMDADKTAQEQCLANEKIDYIWNSTVEEIVGDELVTGVRVKNIKTGEISEVECDGVFMFVGTVPKTDFVKDLIELTPHKYIKTTEKMETNIPGIFAAGDVRDKYLRQVVTAAGDGAIAAVAAEKYVENEEMWQKNVLKAEKPVVVAFWSPVNKESMAVLTKLEVAERDEYDLVKIDAYKDSMLADRYGVKELPAVLRFESGKLIKKYDLEKELDEII